MSDDLQRAIMLGNNVALQWYSAIANKPMPGDAGGISVITPGGATSASIGPGALLLILGALVAAVLIFKK